MDLLLAVLFIIFVGIVGIMPFFIVYAFSGLVRFVLYGIVKYRRDVVEDNIRRSFPGLNPKDLNILVRKVYKNLSDILIEGIKGFTIGNKNLLKRHRVINPEILDTYFNRGQSVLGVLGHFNNWEWGSLSAGKQLKHNIVAIYKPVNNKYIDRFVRKIRARHGTTLASIFETSLTFEKYKSKATLFLLVADQSPSNVRRAIWVDFFGRKTAFLHGPEVHAKKNNLPVFFIDIQRIKRGYYEVEFILLTENPAELKDAEITGLYARKLEDQIRKNPSSWLWTHRRWKLTK